ASSPLYVLEDAEGRQERVSEEYLKSALEQSQHLHSCLERMHPLTPHEIRHASPSASLGNSTLLLDAEALAHPPPCPPPAMPPPPSQPPVVAAEAAGGGIGSEAKVSGRFVARDRAGAGARGPGPLDPSAFLLASLLRRRAYTELSSRERLGLLRCLCDLASATAPIKEHLHALRDRAQHLKEEALRLEGIAMVKVEEGSKGPKRPLPRLPPRPSSATERRSGGIATLAPRELSIKCTHEDRKMYARGACQSCYRRWRLVTLKEQQKDNTG
ncbi:unnamed protein product, partial [Discosporangium mesarthrocarpum]